MMNNNIEIENILEVLKNSLAFYANADNYKSELNKKSAIELDEHGYQARFAINLYEKLKSQSELNEFDYIEFLKTEGELNDDNDLDKS